MTSRSLATMAVLVLALAGCGGDGDDADDSPATEPAAATEAVPEATGGATATGEATDGDTSGADSGASVTVQGIAFQEASVTIAAGSPVTWSNQDEVGHTVTSGGPGDPTGAFDESLPAGGEVTITVDEPGTYAYFCEIHPNMTAELVVEAAS